MYRFSVGNIICIGTLFYLIVGSNFRGFSQEQLSTLKERKARNEKEIVYINSLLKNTIESKKSSLNKLLILNRKIDSREEFINSIGKEKTLLDSRISSLEKNILSIESELKRLRENYGRSITSAYKHKDSHDKLMFLFSSKDFNQAYRRYKYLQQYNHHCRIQAGEILKTRDSLERTIASLKSLSIQKKTLLARKTQESQLLAYEKNQQAELLNKLKKKEQKLRKDLQQQKRYAKELQDEIKRIIRLEAKLAAKREGSSSKFSLTPEERLLSDDFEINRGRLPWPTQTGFISEKFGEHAHPVLKHVKVRNDGINITTDPHSDCRSVFKGVITHVLPMPGLNTVVIIRHGEFFSVYSNLTDVIIKKGDLVSAKQKIGRIFTAKGDGQSVLKFQLWKGSVKLNPSLWLFRN